jgi:phosphatidylinositol kinase/protein kinase (PI-3  family)
MQIRPVTSHDVLPEFSGVVITRLSREPDDPNSPGSAPSTSESQRSKRPMVLSRPGRGKHPPLIPSRSSLEAERYGIAAINAYLKAIELRPGSSLQNLCQMFSVLFSLENSMLLTDDIVRQVLAIPSEQLLTMIPQITAQLNHSEVPIRKLVFDLLVSIGTTYFQEVFFPVSLARHDDSEPAAAILAILRQSHEVGIQDAELFSDGMIRSAVTWFESWKSSLEVASHSDSRHDMVLAARFDEFRHPRCEMDEYFIRQFSPIVNHCQKLFEEHTVESLHDMWTTFNEFYEQLKEKINQLSILLLAKVSERLARRRGFAISIPGGDQQMLDHIDPILEIMGTHQHPRCIYLVSNTGNKVKFLLKGNEDLRLDERLMQFFALVNTLFVHARSRYDFSIVCYPVLPLTKEAGLIRWVTGADTMHHMVMEDRSLRKKSLSRESEICREFMDCELKTLDSLQRLEVFDEICDDCRGLELFEYIWLKSPNAAIWVSRTERFTISSAAMSMIGYIIGLGDRHPSNIMIQKDTGNIIHIDFGESFDSAMARPANPERVPFRLTRMIVNALEGSVTDGLYQQMSFEVMQLIRKHKVTLGTQLGIFLDEKLDITATQYFDSEAAIEQRVFEKLNGTELSDDGSEMPVEDQVGTLIQIAANPQNYVMHYRGWCPFW